MKGVFGLLLLLAIFFAGRTFNDSCESVNVNYVGLDLDFPSSVGEAVAKHDFQFRPPGFYYKNLEKHQVEVMLMYNYELSDFNNENQPRETLYHRILNSYIFRFKERKGLEDSLKNSLERAYGKKFISIQRGSSSGALYFRTFDMHFLEVSPCLVIGLSSSPKDQKSDRKVVVRFLYGLTEEERIDNMRNYL